MYQQSKIRTGFQTYLGFRDVNNSGYPTLSAGNTTSDSGKYFEEYHNLVTIKNLYDCWDGFEISASDATNETNFNTFLTDLKRSAVDDVFMNIFNDIDLIQSNNSLKQNTLLYPYENRIDDTLTNDGDFVGFEFEPKKDKNILIRINNLITEFDASESITFYLFHSSQQAAVSSQAVTVQANSTTFTAVTDFNIDWTSYQGGKWYIGYLTTGLTAQALNRTWNRSNVKNGVIDCLIKPIKVTGHTASTLPDIDSIEYTSNTYGLNFDISVLNDYTATALSNKTLYTDVIGYGFAVKALEVMAFNNRGNGDEKILGAAIAALEGIEGQYTDRGIKKKYTNKLDELKKLFIPSRQIKTVSLRTVNRNASIGTKYY